jgi:hypothetical protein
MKNILALSFLFMLLWIPGCSSITVNHDYNADYNFQALHTYSWLDDHKTVSSDARINNDLVKDRMVKAIESALNAKGYTKVAQTEASFLVSWHGAIDSKLQVDTIDHYYRPYGYGTGGTYDPFMGSGIRQTVVSEYDLGTLLIDILDPKEHKLVWRGTGQGVVHADRTPDERTAEINNAVVDILAQFPPTLQK